MVISALCYVKNGKISDVFFHNDFCNEEINKMYVSIESCDYADYILSMSRPVLTRGEKSYMITQMFDKFKELVHTGKAPYMVTGKDELVVAV